MSTFGYAQVTGHQFTKVSKALRLQIHAASNGNGSTQETGFADAFGSWALVAIPAVPDADSQGTITASCEATTIDYGDQRIILGTRDIRVSKYTQDLKPGEVALVNADGFRLFLGRKKAALVAGGGYLSFDSEKRSLALVGIPSTPGGAAPYITISPTILGLVSATGECSMTLSGANVSLSGAAIVLDFGRISLGKNAIDPVVTHSALMAVIQQMITQFNAHTHSNLGIVPAVPLVLVLQPGTRVFAPKGG